MKKLLSIILLLFSAICGSAQNHNDTNQPIYALVGAADFSDSPGEETLIYEHPDLNAKTIGILSYCYHGLCGATLIKNLGDWYLIDDGVIGYVQASESVLQSWYDGNGDSIMIAAKPKTYIHMDYYGEDDDDGIVITGEYVAKGTILTDRIERWGEDFYVLLTAHDYLYLHKDDVEIISREELALNTNGSFKKTTTLQQNNKTEVTIPQLDDTPDEAKRTMNIPLIVIAVIAIMVVIAIICIIAWRKRKR